MTRTCGMHADSIAIIRRELDDLSSPDPAVRRLAIATIRQEVSTMDRLETEQGGTPRMSDVCARLTYHDGRLIERYR